ncbi:Xylose isomerase domain-containing protein TIM barrel (plasmid) [Gemmatirosa kalamazoonensis]|uniref:Xylose isomerase domain-containing protein TIM barrel n=1 Tax=Gemmatirosa kalamazoonensis TaxID=861299 RepID=W0RR23_9BACT|nr:sugar phosphate isomerase/epimerase family protein [Gemmatirosa kalamazoonensis]AHG93156.1 Xylose isomerase domain-containing protein TIM barrel [Gemmatirosa kalamazoonensis]
MDRRQFVTALGTTLAAGCVHRTSASPSSGRAPLSFSTLGCPNWTWAQILDFAKTHEFAAIELRGIQQEMDLTQRPEFAPARLAQSKREVADHGLRIACLGSSAEMHVPESPRRTAWLDEGRRFIDLAHALDAPYVRVFGNKWVAGEERDRTLDRVAAGLRTLGDHAKGSGVTVVLETHGDFTDSPTIVDIMHRADSPTVALLWDAHHTFAFSHEDPEATARQLMPWVRHVHLKDSVPAGSDRRYVLTGRGDVPVREQVEVLVRHGYRGYYNFEWEKRWHPEIEEPEVAFAQYAQAVREYLRGARA